MPALPELAYGTAHKRIIEVLGEVKAKYPRKTYCHIRVTRKIIIYIHGVGNYPHPAAYDGSIRDDGSPFAGFSENSINI